MRTLFLLVIGIVLLVNSMVVLGAVSLVAALMFGKDAERLWCLILGILLLSATPAWIVSGILAIVFMFTEN